MALWKLLTLFGLVLNLAGLILLFFLLPDGRIVEPRVAKLR
jgi:hypothetical protein